MARINIGVVAGGGGVLGRARNMRETFQRLTAGFEGRRAGRILAGLLAAVYGAAYFAHPLFPGGGEEATTRGWWTWSDQGWYLKQAGALAAGRIDAETYHYPLGYPALGAIFVKAWPANPFFLPDLLLVLGAAAAWWRIARRWLRAVEAAAVGAVFVATHATLLGLTMVVPWNTLATQAALLTGIWGAMAWRGRWSVEALAGLAAVTYVVRPIDALGFGPLLIWLTLARPTWRERVVSGAGGVAVLAVAVVGVGALNLSVFGSWRTPYEAVSASGIGFFDYPAAVKAYWLLVDMRAFFGEWEPALLWRYAWLWLAVPGAVFFVQREGRAAVAVLAAVALNWALYLNYNDFLPSDVYRYTLIHYLTWSFPLLFLLAAVAVRHGWRSGAGRAGFAVAAGLVVFAAGIRLDERPVPLGRTAGGGWRLPATRPLVVRWAGTPAAAVTQLRLDGRALVECADYQVPGVPAELRVVLSERARGAELSGVEGEAVAAELGWAWRFSPARLGRIGR